MDDVLTDPYHVLDYQDDKDAADYWEMPAAHRPRHLPKFKPLTKHSYGVSRQCQS